MLDMKVTQNFSKIMPDPWPNIASEISNMLTDVAKYTIYLSVEDIPLAIYIYIVAENILYANIIENKG